MKHLYAILFVFFIQLSFSQTVFLERSTTLGVPFNYGPGFLGGGVSFVDYNRDGWDDLTLSSQSGDTVRFFRNNNGTYVEETLNIPNNNYRHKTVQWVDYDNDGDYDLYVTSDSNFNRLYQNDGSFNFTDVTITSGLFNTAPYNFGASWGDYNNDGYLDMFLCFREPTQTQANLLYRNNGDGTFTEVGASAGIVQSGDLSFCSAFLDYDNDGWQDIYIANDKLNTRNYMYHNNGDGTFTDVSAATGTDLYMGAMCVTVGDYNNDGYQDMYITNDDNTDPGATNGNALLHNNGDGTFTNVAAAKGLTVDSICWGALFLDANLDTDLDIMTVASRDGTVTRSSSYFESTGNGNFTEPTTSGIYAFDNSISYSNALGDVNNDGFPDIAVVNENQQMDLWLNSTTNSNNYLKIKLQGVISNRDGIGSRIEVFSNGKSQYRYTHCGESYLGQSSTAEFFGIGTETSVDFVQVTWLSGLVDRIDNVSGNQTLTIIEGSSPLSTNDISIEDAVSIYPNPAKEGFNVRVRDAFNKGSIQLLNMLGQEIFTRKLNQQTTQFDISELKAGVYFVKLLVDNTSYTQRLIIE